MHLNIGNPPRVQIICWRAWRLRWHRWQGSISKILWFSVLLGPVEVRVWR
jgi:hypothetical protein